MTYDKLLIEADSEGIAVKEKDLISADGRTKGNNIAIRRDMQTAKKMCVLAEEMGHCQLTVGNIIDLSVSENCKQELRSRLYAYNKCVGLSGIINAYKARCQSQHELAEYLGVTEIFLREAIDCYRAKYGVMVTIDIYTIFFEPSLSVMERYN